MGKVEYTEDYAINRADLSVGTLSQLYLDTVDRYRKRTAFKAFSGDRLVPITHDEALSNVRAAATALRALGMSRGHRAAILSENRPEWAMADFACLCMGVQDVPIYSTLTAHQVAYILGDSGARLVFVSTAKQLEKALEARQSLDTQPTIVVFDDVASDAPGVTTWRQLQEKGRAVGSEANEAVFRTEAKQAKPEDVATVLYTSGTTGNPKGVMLTHANLYSNVMACTRILGPHEGESTLSFLPLSHVLQRMVDYLLLAAGCEIAYPHSIETISEDLRVVRPTIQVAVPRVYEKVFNRVMAAEGVKGRLVQWAREVGEAWSTEVLAGREPSGVLRLVHRLADRLVFRKIRAGVGGRVRFFVSGGGPLSPEINQFFYAAGLIILEGYGLTETSPVTNVNTLEDFRIGTVGRPVPGTEIRIASDGEILVRGPQVMKGYLNNPTATAEAITEDGWFHTGDIGELDEGFLKITDRKKDLIVTAGGKNVAPQTIENLLKSELYVDQAVVVGEGRRFISLLVVPDFAAVRGWAQQRGIEGTSEELCANSEVQTLLHDSVFERLKDLARYEMPKKVALLPSEFTIEDGSLTPSLKVKRKVVENRYKELIDSFYADENAGRTMFCVQ